jgi:predicted metal-binding protein
LCIQQLSTTLLILVAFYRRQGVFEFYEDIDAEILGIVGCGGCPASAIVTRLMQAKLWNMPMNEKPLRYISRSALPNNVRIKKKL